MALNYYRLLGIPPNADQQRIRTVYRGLAKRFHPDANHGSKAAAELFRQVNQAYQVLSNPVARARYDEQLACEDARREKEKPGSTRAAHLDPQQKFNKFLNTLLDALLSPGDPPHPTRRSAAPAQQPQPSKPSFNVFYHKAVAKDAARYERGRDGVYRKARPENVRRTSAEKGKRT